MYVCARAWPNDVPKIGRVGQVTGKIAERVQMFSFWHIEKIARIEISAVCTLKEDQRKGRGGE